MAIHKDLGIHQNLDDWLVRARSHQTCPQHTRELVNNVSAAGLAGELREIRAGASVRNSGWPRGPGPPLFKLGPPQLDFHGPQWATTLTTTCLVW